eukprot:8328502-Alexandrium_andersonii.AAC.1
MAKRMLADHNLLGLVGGIGAEDLSQKIAIEFGDEDGDIEATIEQAFGACIPEDDIIAELEFVQATGTAHPR